MNLKNESYVVYIGTNNFTETYQKDKDGWFKISAKGNRFNMTAEQVLNHLLPAFSGVKSNLNVKVVHKNQLEE